MNTTIPEFIDNENKPVWEAIARQNTPAALNHINKLQPVKRHLLQFSRKNKQVTLHPVVAAAHDILARTDCSKLNALSFSLHKRGAGNFRELIQMLRAFSHGEPLGDTSLSIADVALRELKTLSNEVDVQASDGTQLVDSAMQWIDSMSIRTWSEFLADFFDKKGLLSKRIEVLFYKGMITCNVAGHYPHLVAHDIIQLGEALMLANRHKEALMRFEAVIKDMEHVLDNYAEDPGDAIADEDNAILQALKKAYTYTDEITGQNRHATQIQQLHTLLKLQTGQR